MACPGSVQLSYGLKDDDDDSDFSRVGTAAHAVAAECLAYQQAAWEFIGCWVYKEKILKARFTEQAPDVMEPDQLVLVDREMVDAVQQYLDVVRRMHPPEAWDDNNSWIEQAFYCPHVHPLMYGKGDFAFHDASARTLHIWDYKHGAGIIVEPRWNAQLLYYAVGILEVLELWEDVDRVVLHIAQPRGWHFEGPIRWWTIDVDPLADWANEVLMPAMNLAVTSREVTSGPHCRFCPARRAGCPALLADMAELEALMKTFQLDEKGAARPLTREEVGHFLNLYDTAKIVAKAANATAFAMLSDGHSVPGRKLVKARANRVWKEGAEEAIEAKLGDDAYKVTLLSPAQVETYPEGDKLTARWAQKPDKGFTVAKGEDSRPKVKAGVDHMFKPIGRKK